MKLVRSLLLLELMLLAGVGVQAYPKSSQQQAPQQIYAQSAQKPVLEQGFTAANQLKLKVKEIAPYDQETKLQIICFFKHKASGDTMLSAVADLDKKLGGFISSLRNRGEFQGDELETLWLLPPAGSIKPKMMLLVGLGDEQTLSLDKMHRIGTVALREAVKLKATRVSFAPALRDQGNTTLDTGDVSQAVVQGVILAYDTEKKLQKQGLAEPFTLNEWVMEAGPNFYKGTVASVRKGVDLANSAASARISAPYVTRE